MSEISVGYCLTHTHVHTYMHTHTHCSHRLPHHIFQWQYRERPAGRNGVCADSISSHTAILHPLIIFNIQTEGAVFAVTTTLYDIH